VPRASARQPVNKGTAAAAFSAGARRRRPRPRVARPFSRERGHPAGAGGYPPTRIPAMAGSTFGELFRVTNFGESHGTAIGCVIDGCPPGLALSEADIQPELDRRRPGTSRHVTQRNEPDAVEILSGLYEGLTTGTPIALLIRNTDQRSKDYGNLLDTFRPGHADYTYWRKYGLRDPRGGGRASARLTAPTVAAAAVARKWLKEQYGTEQRIGSTCQYVCSGTRRSWCQHRVIDVTSKG